MKTLNFKKMHGLGNDFVIIDARGKDVKNISSFAKEISHRQLGVGCDQYTLIADPKTDGSDCYMHIFNPDGSEAEACGNVTRCVARLLMDEKNQQSCVIQTIPGLLHCSDGGDGLVTVNMGKATNIREHDLGVEDLPVGVMVDVGNPHAVFFVDDAEKFELSDVGPVVENHDYFSNRTNVEFVSKVNERTLRMRVWERGAGVTMACGSGACATLAAAVFKDIVQAGQAVDIVLDGGTLTIKQNIETKDLYMTGPVTHVFDGVYVFPYE